MNPLFIYIISSWIAFADKPATNSPHVNTNNTTVTRYMEEDILLTCSHDFQNAVGWQFLAHGAKYRSTVTLNSELAEPYAKDERYSLKINRTTGRYDLLIKNLQMPDAGRYFCLERIVNLIIIKLQRPLLVVPSNTVASVGQQVQFHCSTSHQHPVFWQRVLRETGKVLELFVGSVEALASSGKYDMRVDATTGQYDLVIFDVQTSDAGTYICVDDLGFGGRESAELIVLVSVLTCKSNANKDGVITQNDCGLEPEYVTFSCGVRFVGNSAPTLQWKRYNPEVNESATPTGTLQVHNSTITSELSFQADSRLIANSIYTCEIKETMVENIKCKVPQIRTLYIFNSTQILHTKLISEESSLTCLANTSQNCSYFWIEAGNPDVTVSESQQVLLSNDQFGQFQCFVKCTLKGSVCEFNSAPINIPSKKVSEIPHWIFTTFGVLSVLMMIIIIIISCVWWRNKKIRKNDQNTQDGENDHLIAVPSNYAAVQHNLTFLCKFGGDMDEHIRGIAVLNTNVYLIRNQAKHIEVYSYESGEFKKTNEKIEVKDFSKVRYMAACSLNHRIYISDEDIKTIHTVYKGKDKTSNESKYVVGSFPVDQEPEGVSVTQAGHIVITFQKVKQLGIYEMSGKHIRCIRLPESISHPWYAEELNDNEYLIRHDVEGDIKYLITKVEVQSAEINASISYKDRKWRGARSFARTEDGSIFLADFMQHEILLLDPNLKFVEVIHVVTKLHWPKRLCYDEESHYLYVTNHLTKDVYVYEYDAA